MRVTISGPIGSGKSTVGKQLASRLSYKFISGGVFFRSLAKDHGMSIEEFNRYAESRPEIDEKQDKMILEFLRDNDNIVLESRLAGWLCIRHNLEAFKIFLNASFNTRVQRVSYRDHDNETGEMVKLREESEYLRYKKFYGIDYSLTGIYDLVIDTDTLSVEEVVNKIYESIKGKDFC